MPDPTDDQLNEKVAEWMGWELSDPFSLSKWMKRQPGEISEGYNNPTSDPRAWAAVLDECVKRGWYVEFESPFPAGESYGSFHYWTCSIDHGPEMDAATPGRAICLAVVQASEAGEVEAK